MGKPTSVVQLKYFHRQDGLLGRLLSQLSDQLMTSPLLRKSLSMDYQTYTKSPLMIFLLLPRRALMRFTALLNLMNQCQGFDICLGILGIFQLYILNSF